MATRSGSAQALAGPTAARAGGSSGSSERAWILTPRFFPPPVPARVSYAAISVEQGIDLLTDGWVALRCLTAGGDKGLHDFRAAIGIAAMRRPPHRATHEIAPLRPHVWIRATREQQSHDFDMIAEDRVEEGGFAVTGVRVNRHSAVEQEPGHRQLSVSGSIAKGHLLSRRVGGCDELLDDVEAPDPCRTHHTESSTTLDEVLGRFRTTIGQAGIEGVCTIAGQIRVLDLGTVIQQDLDHGNLNARLAGRRARRHESQRGTSTAVHIRLGVDEHAA